MRHFLDFEKPVAELESAIEELSRTQEPGGINIAEEVERLTDKVDKQIRLIYAKLTPWQKTQVARHPERPHALDYIRGLITEFTGISDPYEVPTDAALAVDTSALSRDEALAVVVDLLRSAGYVPPRDATLPPSAPPFATRGPVRPAPPRRTGAP